MKITEKNLKDLGFGCTVVPPEESGDDNEWRYYSLSVSSIPLITPTSDVIKNDEWYVVFLESHPTVKIRKKEQLQRLIYLLKEIEYEQDTP
jgi:hypothetical protein